MSATLNSAGSEGVVINGENPWPGLLSFPEEAEAFFNGRDAERDELLRLIRRETLTLLYGHSGLGKSSLLMAGLFPVLRREQFLPVYVRLDHAETSPTHDRQIRELLLAAASEQGVKARDSRPDESVWEFLHRADGGFWDAKTYPVTPVIVIDQFEEIFTLGAANSARENRSREFLEQLGDLIDNRPPEELLRRLDLDPEAAAGYSFAQPGCKVVLSLREDYLPELRRLREHTSSTLQNDLRLRRMRGDTAVQAILDTGGKLVDRTAAHAIVYFLAKVPTERQTEAELVKVEVEPALLSVVCSELNERRFARRLSRITADLLDGSRTEILAHFYERSLKGLDPRLRVFVEEELLTDSGQHRDFAAYDDAILLPGVSAAGIETLVSRRLIRVEERFGTQRVELTHDVLTEVVRESRDGRRAEEKRSAQQKAHRRRIATGVLALAVLVAGAGGTAAYNTVQGTKARREVRRYNDLTRTLDNTQSELFAKIKEVGAKNDSLAQADSTLRNREAALDTAEEQLARQQQALEAERAAAKSAHALAEQREREASVHAAAAEYYLLRNGALALRQAAQAIALDSTVDMTILKAERIQQQAEMYRRDALRREQAVIDVLCRPVPKTDPIHGVRDSIDARLGAPPLCAIERRAQAQ